MATKSGIQLLDGEHLVAEIEAELWAANANPIVRFLGSIQKLIARIFGSKRTGFLVITNQRVVEISSTVACYCFEIGRELKVVLPASIKEVGYTKQATFGMFCPAFFLYYEGYTQRTLIQIKGGDDSQLVGLVNAFVAAVRAR
jgi:hypothetical protein